MKAYTELTVTGQARRLRALALSALAHYELGTTRLRLITNDMNGIFRVDTLTGEKYILRVSLPEGGHNLAHAQAEVDWLEALASETDLSVPLPLAARDGCRVVSESAPGVPEPRLCALFTWVPGRNLAKVMTPKNLASMGELAAGLHAHAGGYRPRSPGELLHFDRVFPFPEPLVLFDPAYAALMPPARQAVFQQGIAWAGQSIERLAHSGEPMRLLHGDLHAYNVLCCRGRLSPIDFEDLMLGWPVQDIGVTLFHLGDQAASDFRAGYCRRAPWPERFPGEVDSFIAARGIGLANFLLNDPNSRWRAGAEDFLARVEQRVRLCIERSRR